jgi:hypothetical protein
MPFRSALGPPPRARWVSTRLGAQERAPNQGDRLNLDGGPRVDGKRARPPSHAISVRVPVLGAYGVIFYRRELNFPVSEQKTARLARYSSAQREFAPPSARSASLAQRSASRSTWSCVPRSCAASAKFRQSNANSRYFAAASVGVSSLAASQGLPAMVLCRARSPHANDCHCAHLSHRLRALTLSMPRAFS